MENRNDQDRIIPIVSRIRKYGRKCNSVNKEENSYWGKSKENVNRGKEGKIQKGRETKTQR